MIDDHRKFLIATTAMSAAPAICGERNRVRVHVRRVDITFACRERVGGRA
jgi:hypothetical protein